MTKKLATFLFGILIFYIGSMQCSAEDYSSDYFPDINPTDWYAIHVYTLSEMNLASGYCDSTFQPQNSISRAEFIVIAMKAKQHHFPAAQDEHWAMHYIREAAALGIIDSAEAESTDLDEPITRAEAAKILVRVFDTQNSLNNAQDLASDNLEIKDFDAIPECCQPYVLRVFANGWISGFPDGEFKPEHQVTRAQASVLMVNALEEEAVANIERARAIMEELLTRQQEEEEALRQSILETAFELQGTPYRFGGSTPAGFDCSGFVRYVLNQYGINVPHSSAAIYQVVEKISFTEIKPGDLVFFRGYRAGPSHVGIYTGNGKFIHAPSSGRTVSTDLVDDPYYWGARKIGAARVL